MNAIGQIRAAVTALMPVGRYIVEGPSMEPAFHDGDRLVVNRLAYHRKAPAAGDAVVVRDPDVRARFLLKRIAVAPDHIDPGPRRLYLLGDNAGESRDSRHFGLVHRRDIIGKVWFRY